MPFSTAVIKEETIALEHYAPDGELQDKKMLFVHSAGHGSWLWKNFLSYFAEKGYDSWAANLRGHYLAGPVEDWAEVGVNEYLEDLDKAVKKVGGNIVLIGHSMTGVLILKYAESHQVAGLIVSQSGVPKPILDKRGIELKRSMPKGAQRMITDKAILPMKDREMVKTILFDKGNVDEEAIDLVIEKIGEESLRVGQEIMQMALDPEKITVPLFVLGFDSSKIGMEASVDLNKVLAEEFKAKDYKVIEPGGHNYMLEKNWQDFAQQFETWVSSM
jgi:pimeloyl-ACP methyl ester carboxylesterase